MPAEARRLQIIELLGKTGTGVVSVSLLAQQFGVSEMTVRRDLDWLEERSVLTRVHGGAMVYRKDAEKPFEDRLAQSNPQKAAIGWAAAQLVHAGERVILDAGTTTQQIARNLVSLNSLTIITNNVAIVADLAHHPQMEVILLGGTLKHQEVCTVGPMVTRTLAALRVDRLFLSAAGFDDDQGVSDPDMREVEVKQAMIHCAREVILVCDSSKWGKVHLMRTAQWFQIHKVVTDDRIPPEAVEALLAAGVEVITPEGIAASIVRSAQRGQAG